MDRAATTKELMASIGLTPTTYGQKSCEVSVWEIFLDFFKIKCARLRKIARDKGGTQA